MGHLFCQTGKYKAIILLCILPTLLSFSSRYGTLMVQLLDFRLKTTGPLALAFVSVLSSISGLFFSLLFRLGNFWVIWTQFIDFSPLFLQQLMQPDNLRDKGLLEDPQRKMCCRPSPRVQAPVCTSVSILYELPCASAMCVCVSTRACQECVWQRRKSLDERLQAWVWVLTLLFITPVGPEFTDSPAKWVWWCRSSIPPRVSEGSWDKEQKYSLVINRCNWEL